MNDAARKPDAKEQLPTRNQFKRLAECRTIAEAFECQELREKLAEAIPQSTLITPLSMLATWRQCVAKSPLIMQADLRQALGAFQSLAFLGLQPNTHLNLAHIIPFKRTKWNPATKKREEAGVDIQVIIGYAGYIELASRSGAVKSLHADVVYDPDAERFDYSYGTNKHLTHGPKPPGFKPRDGAHPLYAYAWVKLAEDDQFEVMTWPEIESIRNRSQAYRTAQASLETAKEKGWRVPATWTEAPWVRDEAEMAKKSAIRRLMKVVSKSPELRAAVAIEDAQDRTTLDFGPIIDGQISPISDGVPENEPEPPEEARYSTGQMQQSPPPAQQQEPKPQPKPRREPAPKVTDVPQEPTAPAFEAAIIDEFGEIASDTFTDPAAYVRNLLAHWRRMDKTLTEALLEHNSDAIAALRTDYAPIAAALSEIEAPGEEPAPGGEPEPVGADFDEPLGAKDQDCQGTPVLPLPGRDSLPDWKSYPNQIKIALGAVPAQHLPDWVNVQRETLALAPAQYRLPAVKEITTAFARADLHPPPFLGEIIKPKATQGITSTVIPSEEGATTPTADQRWAAGHIAEIDEHVKKHGPREALIAIKLLAKDEDTRKEMRRLRTEGSDGNRESQRLFDQVDGHYQKVIADLEAKVPA